MYVLTPKIEFYRLRNFSDKLNATFQFIRENWKPLIKFTFYLLLPICLIQTIAMNSYMLNAMRLGQTNDFNSFNPVSFFTNYGLLMLIILIGSILLSALVYSLIQTYNQRENRLVNIQWADFKEQLIKNAKRSLTLLVVGVGVFLLVALLFGAIGAGLYSATSSIGFTVFIVMIFMLALLILVIPLSLMMPIYIFDTRINLRDTVAKAFKWGFNHFWSLLGFLIVVYIITNVLQTVTMMPWYITTIVGSLMSLETDPGVTQSLFYKFAIYILGIIQAMGTYIATIIMLIGIAYQYAHLREKYEGVTIESNITNFNELQ
ncbi:MAG: hypothetical protein LBE91_12560 [Tannerella sp.]|jgi:hypothetical protein|nr:hypothetical protein [Tannerella sp.]